MNSYESLITAARRGEVAILTELLQAGADVNVVNEQGITPLMVATYHHQHLFRKVVVSLRRKRERVRFGRK